jgi:hypothetical protein
MGRDSRDQQALHGIQEFQMKQAPCEGSSNGLPPRWHFLPGGDPGFFANGPSLFFVCKSKKLNSQFFTNEVIDTFRDHY